MSLAPSTRATVLRAARVGVGGIVGAGILIGELQLARRAIPVRTEAPRGVEEFGSADATRTLRLALIGDSSAAGVGCETHEQTPGALLALALVERGYRVHLDVLAVSGSRSGDLAPQVSRALLTPPDLAVICIGANDVTHLVAADVAAPLLGDAVLRLRESGAAVLVATCPDLGSIRPVPQPLRQVGHLLSRRMTWAQSRSVRAAGGLPVDIGRLLGPMFLQQRDELFSQDRFHPSALGYQALVDALLIPMESLLPR